jgi:hypothetical protein
MKAAVIGGAVAGVLSGLPIISGCCFLWAIGGGFLAVFMYLKGAPAGMTPGDGAKLGLTAGIVAAVVSFVLGLPFLLLGIGSAALQSSDMERAGISSGLLAAGGVIGLVIRAGAVLGFAVLGGVIGAAVLGKNRPGGTNVPPPPPPSDYSGGGYGGTGTGGGYAGGPGVGGGYGDTSAGGGGYGGGSASGSDFGGTTDTTDTTGTTGTGGTGGTTGGGSTFGTGS